MASARMVWTASSLWASTYTRTTGSVPDARNMADAPPSSSSFTPSRVFTPYTACPATSAYVGAALSSAALSNAALRCRSLRS